MSEQPGSETFTIQELAAQMLENQGIPVGQEEADEDNEYVYDAEDDDDEPDDSGSGNVHWQSILSQIPEEYHEAIIPTLQGWDRGVNRRFQKIHQQYDKFRDFEEIDPDTLREATNVYQSLLNDPASTWETIGRVFGLSPQGTQADDYEEDEEYEALPDYVKERLAAVDEQGRMLQLLMQQVQQQSQQDQEAEEDAELEEYLEELREEYGDFDEDYVVGLIAAGIDGEEAVERFHRVVGQPQEEPSYGYQRQAPRVMSSGGGIPVGERIDLRNLTSQDTRNLIVEALRLSSSE